MYWVVQSNIFSEEGWNQLIETLDRLEITYSVHKCVPFLGTLEPEAEPPPGPVIVMGSYTLANVAKQRGWQPGSFINDNLDYRVQMKYWGPLMFNFGAWIGRLADVPFQPEPFFIRPVKDDKAFSGYVTDWGEFKPWLEREQRQSKLYPQDGGAYFSENTEVLVCRKKTIVREFRTWIVNGVVVTASQYKVGTHVHHDAHVDERVINFAKYGTCLFQPADAFVLDVFEDEHGQLFIGEVNNINSAGFYAADLQKLVHALDTMYSVRETRPGAGE